MGQPTITPGSNGYQSMIPMPMYGANPWSQASLNDQAYALQQQSQGNQTISGLQGQLQGYQNMPQDGSYPTYPNSYGLGSQNAFGTAAPAAPADNGNASLQINPGVSGGQSPTPDVSSRGFNPWSLQGEANAR